MYKRQAVFFQFNAGDRVQTEACHIFVQCGNGLFCGAVIRVAHAVTQFIEEVVTGYFQRMRNVDSTVGTAIVAVNPAAGVRSTGVFEYPFVCNDSCLLYTSYYPDTPDGIYGTKTYEAIRQFQADNGLKVDGIAGLSLIHISRSHKAPMWQKGKSPDIYSAADRKPRKYLE